MRRSREPRPVLQAAGGGSWLHQCRRTVRGEQRRQADREVLARAAQQSLRCAG